MEKSEFTELEKQCKSSYLKKSRNKFLIETNYDNISRKAANDIMNNFVKARRGEKEAYRKLPKDRRDDLTKHPFKFS